MSETIQNQPELSFDEIIENLKDAGATLSSKQIMRLSGIYPNEIDLLKENWSLFDSQRINGVLEDMETLTEDYPGVDFSEIFLLGLDDKNDAVVITSIQGLWDEENLKILIKALEILRSETPLSTHVSLALMALLGEFLILAELDKVPELLANEIKSDLLTIYHDCKHESLRQRALEVLAPVSDLDMTEAIDKAIHDYNDDWLLSGLIAIGKSGKTQWNDYVFDNLDSITEDIRIEAIRTAGELELQDALSELYASTKDGLKEIRMASAWALSNYPDKNIHDTLQEMLENAEDEEEEALIEDAIDNHMVNSEIMTLDMLGLDQDSE